MKINSFAVSIVLIAFAAIVWLALGLPSPEGKDLGAKRSSTVPPEYEPGFLRSEKSIEAAVGKNNPPILVTNNSKISEFARDFQTSKNYREYIDKAKLAPEKGGLFYAYVAASLCERWSNWFGKSEAIPYEAEVDHAHAQKKQVALEEIRSRCNGVLPGEFGQDFKRMKSDDPIFQTINAIFSEDAVLRAAGLEKFFESADPVAMDFAWSSLTPSKVMNPGETDSEKIVVSGYYDGHWYQGESLLALQYATGTLLPCYFGWKCDETGTDVLASCVMFDVCGKTRFDIVRDVYFKG
ncbi:MAG: hypothetical protein WCC58_05130, partial [Burkholderiales bacterium]